MKPLFSPFPTAVQTGSPEGGCHTCLSLSTHDDSQRGPLTPTEGGSVSFDKHPATEAECDFNVGDSDLDQKVKWCP